MVLLYLVESTKRNMNVYVREYRGDALLPADALPVESMLEIGIGIRHKGSTG